jgi:hypothetical protein
VQCEPAELPKVVWQIALGRSARPRQCHTFDRQQGARVAIMDGTLR